jgi:hypothetical protein
MSMGNLTLVAVATWLLGAAVPAFGEHLRLTPEARPAAPAAAEPARPATDVDVTLHVHVDADGFRLGARFSGEQGVSGAWLDGQLRPDGLALDGRVEGSGRVYSFKLDAAVLRALAGAVGGRWLLPE